MSRLKEANEASRQTILMAGDEDDVRDTLLDVHDQLWDREGYPRNWSEAGERIAKIIREFVEAKS